MGRHRDRRCFCTSSTRPQSSRCSMPAVERSRPAECSSVKELMSHRGGSTGCERARGGRDQDPAITAGSSLSFTLPRPRSPSTFERSTRCDDAPSRQGYLYPHALVSPVALPDPNLTWRTVPFPAMRWWDINRSYWSCRVASQPRRACVLTEAAAPATVPSSTAAVSSTAP